MLIKNTMKIGIIEIMPRGHNTLIESLIKIYSADSQSEIKIFTDIQRFEILKPFIQESDITIDVVFKDENEKIKAYLNRISGFKFDKLYIVTLDKYFRDFQSLSTNNPIYLFVHNIEDWFQISFKVLSYKFFFNLSKPKYFIFSIKTCLIYPLYKKRIKNNVIQSGGKFVVLNKILKAELSLFVNPNQIEVIPFSVYIPELNTLKDEKRILRVCIPGVLDNFRRDYFSVFKCLEDNLDFYKDKIELNLLGSTNSKSEKIIFEAEKLIKKGLNIIYHQTPYIPFDEYNNFLNHTDIILGNINTNLSKFSVYGKTKDTGTIFVMIKKAKPGILPENYALIDELQSSTLTYRTYSDLENVLKKLVSEPEIIQSLTKEALKNSKHFDPLEILNSL
jgi:hypothetical protein